MTEVFTRPQTDALGAALKASLLRLLADRPMSTEDLAQLAGVKVSTLVDIFQSRSSTYLTDEDIAALADVLGISFEELLTGGARW